MGVLNDIKNLDKNLTSVTPKRSSQIPGETSRENIPKRFGNGTGFSRLLPKVFEYFGAGTYPKNYNARVHGPYYPFRYYGKADPLMECKVGDLKSWFLRREKGVKPFNMIISRGWWNLSCKYFHVARPALYVVYFYVAFGMLNNLVNQYGKYSNNRHAKYR